MNFFILNAERSMRRIIIFYVGLSFVLMSIGCSRTVIREGTHPPVDVPGENTGVRWNSASIVDDAIADKIAIKSISTERSPTQTLVINVVIMNRTDYNQQVECRTQFFNADKIPCEKPSAWKRVYLPANSIETYTESSMKTTEVAFFYVEIREGR